MKLLTVFVFLNVASFVVPGISLESVFPFTPKSTISLPSPSSIVTNSDSTPEQEQEQVDGGTDMPGFLNGTNYYYNPDNITNSNSSSDQEESVSDNVEHVSQRTIPFKFQTDFILANSDSTPEQEQDITVIPAFGLPQSCNTWWTIRKKNKVYVDKTDILDYLISEGSELIFCARPRRFGKTLFAQMVKSYFSGEKHLFKGLMISERRNGNIIHSEPNGSWIQYPVIALDFSAIYYKGSFTHNETLKHFEKILEEKLNTIADNYAVNYSGSISLTTLIQKLHTKFKLPVVITIDEYDSPIINAVYKHNNRLIAKKIFEVIEYQFEAIKSNLEIIAFAWVTGVTKLPIPALHSSFNNHVDLSHEKSLTRIGGFTKSEIKHNFGSDLESFSKARNVTKNRILELLQSYYDGYMFSVERPERVYNPVSVITALRKFKIGNYWVSTGAMDYIVKRISTEDIQLEYLEDLLFSTEYVFQCYDIIDGEAPLVAVMFQTGYLTIVKYEETKCWLNFPNMEIRLSLLRALYTYIPLESNFMKEVQWFSSLRSVLDRGDIPEAVRIINKAGFRFYKSTLSENVDEMDVTRRIIAMLNVVGVLSEASKQFFWGDPVSGQVLKGDTDITTVGLKTNYVWELKCGEAEVQSISSAVKQLLRYISKDEETRVSFVQRLGNPYMINLLAVHVHHKSGGRIDEWVCIPYKGRKLILDGMQASSKELLDKMDNMIKNTVNSTHISDKRLPN